jgi:hypothetical protein
MIQTSNKIINQPRALFYQESIKKTNEILFSADDLIDAYQTGKIHAFDQINSIIKNEFDKNIQKINRITKETLDLLKTHNFNGIAAHLKICNLNNFVLLFSVRDDLYLDEKKLTSIYNELIVLSNSYIDKDFYVEINLANESDSFNLDEIALDGYIGRLTFE